MSALKNISLRIKYVLSIVALILFLEVLRVYVFSYSEKTETLISIIIASSLSYGIASLVAGDLKKLSNIFDRVVKGDLDVEIEVNGSDEIGTLSNGFNQMIKRLQARINSSDILIDVMKNTSKETELNPTLDIILKGAQKLTGAKYAALAVFDENKKVKSFLHLGMDEGTIKKIGHYPEGKGLLGYIHETKKILRLDNMAGHFKSYGFPQHHPAMKSLLAAPLLFGNRSLGNLYLSDKDSGDGSFNEDDEHAIEIFAQIAANVIREKTSSEELLNSKIHLEKEVTLILSVIDKLASGDFMVRLDHLNNNDDISRLKTQINRMIDNLKSLIVNVKEIIDAAASASSQISASSEEMSAGASEQEFQAMEVSEAIDQMTKTILETSKNSTLAASSASKAGDSAKQGGKTVIDTIHGMNKISEAVLKSAETIKELGKSSYQIGEITQVIEEIADQTNLLALNAAIEAARAGEQGRGFAVVADEVRKLAERTTKATGEITAMIKKIQDDTQHAVEAMTLGTKEVETGKNLAKSAENSLTDIISSTENVNLVVANVAAAAEEQSKASENIAQNIDKITLVTKENATGIIQIAKATDDLTRLTLNLKELINKFKTEIN